MRGRFSYGSLALLLSLGILSMAHAQSQSIASAPVSDLPVPSTRITDPTCTFFAIRDLCHLPFEELLQANVDSNWIVATFTSIDRPVYPGYTTDPKTGKFIPWESELYGAFYGGKVIVQFVVGQGVPITMTDYRVLIAEHIFISGPSEWVNDRLKRSDYQPFRIGGEALVRVFPEAKGNHRFAQMYFLPAGWGRYIAEAMPVIQSDPVLRAAVRQPADPQPSPFLWCGVEPNTPPPATDEQVIPLTADAESHLTFLLQDKNPLIVVIAYKALERNATVFPQTLAADGGPPPAFFDSKYGTLLWERQLRAQGTEALLYRTLLFSAQQRWLEDSRVYARVERDILNTSRLSELAQIALTIRADAGFTETADTLIEQVRKRADILIAHPAPGATHANRDEDKKARKVIQTLSADSY